MRRCRVAERTLQEQIDAALAEGYEIVQQGVVHTPAYSPLSTPFSERVHGLNIALLGNYTPPTYRPQYENLLFDDDERWVHLRRDRSRDG